MIEVLIAERKHPVHFGWLELETISLSIGHKSPDDTANNIVNLVNNLQFTRLVAFEGVKAGYRKIGEACPFKTSEDLVDEVKNITEINPIIEEWVKRQAEFYQIEEPSKKKEAANP